MSFSLNSQIVCDSHIVGVTERFKGLEIKDTYLKKDSINFYLLLKHKKNSNLFLLYKYSVHNNRAYKIKVEIKNEKLLSDDDEILDFAYSRKNDLLAILTWDNFFIINCSTKRMEVSVGIKKYQKIYSLDDTTFLLVRNYNFHPSTVTDQFVLTTINTKGLVIETKAIDYKHDIPYTMLVNKFIDVYEDKIIYSKTTDSKIYFLNKKLELTDSLCFMEDLFSKNVFSYDEKDVSFRYRTAQEVYVNLKKYDSLNYRIEKVFYNTLNSILVSLKPPGTSFHKRILVLLERKNDKFVIQKIWDWNSSSIYDCHSNLNFTYSLNNLIIKDYKIYQTNFEVNKKLYNRNIEDVYDYFSYRKKNKVCIYSFSFSN